MVPSNLKYNLWTPIIGICYNAFYAFLRQCERIQSSLKKDLSNNYLFVATYTESQTTWLDFLQLLSFS